MIKTVHLFCFPKHIEFTRALSKGKTILSFGGGVDRSGVLRVNLEIEKQKAANLCLQGKPRGAGQDRESDLPSYSQPPKLSV